MDLYCQSIYGLQASLQYCIIPETSRFKSTVPFKKINVIILLFNFSDYMYWWIAIYFQVSMGLYTPETLDFTNFNLKKKTNKQNKTKQLQECSFV